MNNKSLKFQVICTVKNLYYVVPENTHTPLTEWKGISWECRGSCQSKKNLRNIGSAYSTMRYELIFTVKL